SIIFPVGVSDPFIAYSPVSRQMIVSATGHEKNPAIYAIDSDGERVAGLYSKEQRDSLLPQIYFTQLMAREQLPDSIDGIELTVPALKHGQWVFSSLPRDINKVQPEVYLMMESMPARIDLEDPKEVFRFRNGRVEFIDMETNGVVEGRTRRFTDIFNERDFQLPVKSASANVTSRKPYDEGYLMVDNRGDIFHLKMQAGRPYMMKVRKPDSINARHVFIMENVETRHLGLMTDDNDNLYVIEREGYRICPLAVGKVNPAKDRISVVKNLFNWVVKVSNSDGARWTVLDSDDYSKLADYNISYSRSVSQMIASYIFPFELSFTAISDCYAFPRISDVSWHAVFLNIVLALIVLVVYRRRRASGRNTALASGATVIFVIFSFIPLMLIKD
ncbi:MAG: DUF4857 domain-containing protein, partial [Duncaniella sp.]|nr:DUF4857 domain-containing protein [Duncaniella sp.]